MSRSMPLRIRKMRPDDFGPLYQLLSDPRVMRYLEPPFSAERTQRFLEEAGLCTPPLICSVELQGRFIGYVIYHDYDKDSVEIGWVLAPDCWGKGYASELTKQLIRKADRDRKDVVIECVPQQAITRHIAQKHGFAACGEADGLDVFRLSRISADR